MTKGSSIPLLDLPERQILCGFGAIWVEHLAKKTNLPLAGVDLKARVADRIAEVTVTQKFQNPYTEHLEAVYIFPLSAGAAVSKYTMRVGSRVIVGRVDERAQARQQYAQAIQQGQRAALLEQERDDVFTVQVGNIPPGEEIVIELTYSERLPFFADGTTEIRLPLVVAPRYMAGATLNRDTVGHGTAIDTNLVPDASRITPPRLAAGFDAKVDLSISVDLIHADDAKGGGLADLKCSQHAVQGVTTDGVTNISLLKDNEHLNRDFVLRWRLTEEKLRSTFVYIKDPESEWHYGMLSLVPPSPKQNAEQPRDVVFVVDRSGSMEGVKMTSAARACAIVLNTLGPSDRFAIQAYDNVAEWMNFVPPKTNPTDWWSDAAAAVQAGVDKGLRRCLIPANENGIRQGLNYLRSIGARGGTETGVAMDAALDLLEEVGADAARVPVIVLITDGEIGAEAAVIAGVQKRLGATRVFTVGVDTAVNDGFLKRLASIGKGTCTFVEPGLKLEAALVNVGREIGAPLITDLKISDDGAAIDASTIVPAHIPDLFVARASSCFFKFKLKSGMFPLKKSGPKPNIKLTGKQFGNGEGFSTEVKGVEVPLNAVAQLWAKNYIDELEDQFRVATGGRDKIKEQIVGISIKHSVLCKFTAFVVVDEAEIVNLTGDSRTVVQPVEQPAQWEMQAQSRIAQAMPMAAPFAANSGSWGSAPAPKSKAHSTVGKFLLDQGDLDSLSIQRPAQAPSWGQQAAQSQPQPAPPCAPAPGGGGGNFGGGQDAGWGSTPAGGSWSQEPEQLETGSWKAFEPSSNAPSQPAADVADAWAAPAPSVPPPAPAASPAPPFKSLGQRGELKAKSGANDSDEPLTLAESIRRKVTEANAAANAPVPLASNPREELVKRYNDFTQAFEKAVRAGKQGHRDTLGAEHTILAFLQHLRLLPQDSAVIVMHEFVLNHAASFMGVHTNTSVEAQRKLAALGEYMWPKVKFDFDNWLTEQFRNNFWGP